MQFFYLSIYLSLSKYVYLIYVCCCYFCYFIFTLFYFLKHFVTMQGNVPCRDSYYYHYSRWWGPFPVHCVRCSRHRLHPSFWRLSSAQLPRFSSHTWESHRSHQRSVWMYSGSSISWELRGMDFYRPAEELDKINVKEYFIYTQLLIFIFSQSEMY